MENLQLPAGWAALLRDELSAPYFAGLMQRVAAAYDAGAVFPPQKDVFAAFRLTPPERVRAVILGQDPYHEPGQAHGLAFSVRDGVRMPPSLVTIGKELASDVGATLSTGCLTGWAEQGVFLLNTVLTVEQGRANSHSSFGWQRFTDAAVAALAQLPQPVAFVLWGAQAQKKPPRAGILPIRVSCSKRRTPAPSAPTAAFRQPSLLADQRLSRRPWRGAYQMESLKAAAHSCGKFLIIWKS